MVIAAIDPDPRKAKDLKKWGRAYWEAIHPFNPGGGYVNFMMDDENDDRMQTTYGPNYKRLTEVKKKYDPKNLFRVNQNIRPAA
jgi:FAD/FMN-containing dehydrogenase